MWSEKYKLECCEECGTSEKPHEAHGLCSVCYYKAHMSAPGKKEEKAIKGRISHNRLMKDPIYAAKHRKRKREWIAERMKDPVYRAAELERHRKRQCKRRKTEAYKIKAKEETKRFLEKRDKDPVRRARYLEMQRRYTARCKKDPDKRAKNNNRRAAKHRDDERLKTIFLMHEVAQQLTS